MFFSSSSEWFGRFPYRINTTEKVLALTFDDGPNGQYTKALLEVLCRHRVRATFFVVGKNVETFPNLIRTMQADGHCIGNHTYSHRFLSYFSKSVFIKEVQRTQKVITNITGTTPTLFRPPWLYRLPWILQVVRAEHLTPISAVFGYEFEVLHQNGYAMACRAAKKVRPGIILDFHDGFDAKGGYRQGTVDAINTLVPLLQSQGYTFLTVPELLQHST